MNGCSVSDRFTDHDSIQEDEEPNDENSNSIRGKSSGSAVSDDNSNVSAASDPSSPPHFSDNGNGPTVNGNSRLNKGYLHEMRTEL